MSDKSLKHTTSRFVTVKVAGQIRSIHLSAEERDIARGFGLSEEQMAHDLIVQNDAERKG